MTITYIFCYRRSFTRRSFRQGGTRYLYVNILVRGTWSGERRVYVLGICTKIDYFISQRSNPLLIKSIAITFNLQDSKTVPNSIGSFVKIYHDPNLSFRTIYVLQCHQWTSWSWIDPYSNFEVTHCLTWTKLVDPAIRKVKIIKHLATLKLIPRMFAKPAIQQKSKTTTTFLAILAPN